MPLLIQLFTGYHSMHLSMSALGNPLVYRFVPQRALDSQSAQEMDMPK